MSDEITITSNEYGGQLIHTPSPVHIPTLGFRWKNGVLQQRWQEMWSGEVEWRDVPTWKEGDPE